MNTRKKFLTLMLISLCALAACGDKDASNKNIFQTSNEVKKYATDVILSGSVSTNDGLVSKAHIVLADASNKEIVSTVLDAQGQYQLQVPAGTVLPVLITAQLQDDSTQTDTLMVAVIDPGLKKNDINQLTTAIAKKAKALGGYTYSNMSQAAMSSTSVPRSNQTTGGFSGDPTSQYGGWH